MKMGKEIDGRCDILTTPTSPPFPHPHSSPLLLNGDVLLTL